MFFYSKIQFLNGPKYIVKNTRIVDVALYIQIFTIKTQVEIEQQQSLF